ncbi:hypothetical protein [uncultured Bacteroides sp.]|uniref:hypothetical protein n=1 Tax=uncultured Bacteroides sp. TaxID=162156 RepID=UPI00260E943F|nr:hypothetical protein [uncultured Bacteroides sp.]
MKIITFIVCLIVAAIVYFIAGLIAWNIVCSWIDIQSCTIIELSDYRIFTYTGVAILSSLTAIIKEDLNKDSIITVLLVTGFIAYLTNHWENVWDSVALIITILYNIINIYIIGASFYEIIDKD